MKFMRDAARHLSDLRGGAEYFGLGRSPASEDDANSKWVGGD